MYYLIDWGHQGDLILLLLHSTDQPLHRLTLPSGRPWSRWRRWTGKRLLTLGRCSNLKLLAGTESKTFHFRLVGTVITGMVDPNVPSFWPHNEVHFHLIMLICYPSVVMLWLITYETVSTLLDCIKFLPFTVVCFQTWESYKARLEAAEDEEH